MFNMATIVVALFCSNHYDILNIVTPKCIGSGTSLCKAYSTIVSELFLTSVVPKDTEFEDEDLQKYTNENQQQTLFLF